MIEFIDGFIFIIENWKRKFVLLAISFSILVKYLCFLYSETNFFIDDIFGSLLDNKKIQYTSLIYLTLWLFSFGIWLYSRRITKTKKGQIGIVFAIETDNRKVKLKVKKDFIECIKNDLKNYGKFHIIDLSEYYVDRIKGKNKAEAILLNKTNSKLIIYGKVELRKKDCKDCYYLQFNAVLQHKPISKEESKMIGNDMRSVIPVDQFIWCDTEFDGFQFTTKLYSIVSRFFLGISAYVSNDNELALKLHHGVYVDTTVIKKTKMILLFIIESWIKLKNYLFRNRVI